MQAKQGRFLMGGGIAAAVLLVGATVFLKPAVASPTITVYTTPT